MAEGFPESDWRILRKLHPVALDRFCRRILDEIAGIVADSGRSHHERYLALYQLVERRDRELAQAFNDMRRSRAVERILYLRRLGLLDEDEYGRFSAGTRRSVDSILAHSD